MAALIQGRRIRSSRRWTALAADVTRNATNCYRCGRAISTALPVGHPAKATADHIIPIARGGAPFDPGNVAAMCWLCNTSKQDRIDVRAECWID